MWLSGAPIAGGKLFSAWCAADALSRWCSSHRRNSHRVAGADFRHLFRLGSQAIRLGLFPRLDLLQHSSGRMPVRLFCLHQLVAFGPVASCSCHVRLQFGAGGSLWAGRVRRDVHHLRSRCFRSLATFGIGERPPPRWFWGALSAVNASSWSRVRSSSLKAASFPFQSASPCLWVMTTWRWGRQGDLRGLFRETRP